MKGKARGGDAGRMARNKGRKDKDETSNGGKKRGNERWSEGGREAAEESKGSASIKKGGKEKWKGDKRRRAESE